MIPTFLAFAAMLAPTPSEITQSIDVATRLFGVPSCGQPALASISRNDIQARGFGYSPALVNNGDCTIYLADDQDWRDFPLTFCTVYVHEWGHLAGHAHSNNPTSIMYGGAYSKEVGRAIGCTDD